MNENNELLMHIYKASEMGVESTKMVLDCIKTKVNKIKHVLESELKEYEKYFKISRDKLKKQEIKPKGNKIITKMSSDLGVYFETMKDNSDAAIASMMVEGLTMGVIEMETKISNYQSTCEEDILKIAKDFLEFQNNEVNKLKTFM